MSQREQLTADLKRAVNSYAACVADNVRRKCAGGTADEKAEEKSRRIVDAAIQALAGTANFES